MEHLHDHGTVESFSEPEGEPTSLVVDELPLQDPDLSTVSKNETLPVPSERRLKISEQPSSESAAVNPEQCDVPLKANQAAGMAEMITSEDLPMQPDSANQTCNSLQDSAQTQLSPVPSPKKLAPPPSEDQPVTPTLLQRHMLLVPRKTAPVLAKVPDSRSVDPASTPLIRARSVLANQYLQRIGHLRSAQEDTCPLAEDTTSIEETTLEPPENCKKGEFEELTLKLHDAEQSAVTSQAHQQPEGDAKSKDFETPPVCGRIAFWRKRESDAVYKGMAPDSNVCKQGRLPISDTGLRPDPQQ
ncbi:mediator of DNA damage checkpoint protein 1-like [Dermacentor albipictus]|uniref:mediator of DNA damage checkpoint protein 1-like n=1 Tax=Dermacentor albipictus TaxID=60249 RepID=UPI0038FC2BA6